MLVYNTLQTMLKPTHFDADMNSKRFSHFRSQLRWPLYIKFTLLITLAQRYVSTELEVSTDFLFQTDVVQQVMRSLGRTA